MEADFSGYVTKNGLKCSDGRTIMPDAFKHNDQQTVPLVWQHMHNEPTNVLGHAVLENRKDGVYGYGYFNSTDAGVRSKELVQHGDIVALSIYANNLSQRGENVMHGDIKEVSLVLAGANPGAFIDNVNLKHGDTFETLDEEAVIFTGLALEHNDKETEVTSSTIEHADDKTVKDVFDSLTEEQKNVVYYLLGEAISNNTDGPDAKHSELSDDSTIDEIVHSMNELQQGALYTLLDDALAKSPSSDLQHQEGTTSMTRNVFQSDADAAATKNGRPTLSHAQISTIVQDGIKLGSFKESFLAHAVEYGIENIDLMFPDAKSVSNSPELIARQAEWVPKVLGATKHAPFAKIKSLVADLTAAEARAKGYIKGNEKTEEVIKLLRRTTGPTTVYKKQKLDRDDILDITDFDVIAWLKWEIRFMLNEEIARAILIGDGRSTLSQDKIKDPEGAVDGTGIRSIANDNPLYAHPVSLAANVSAGVVIDEVSRARTHYRGSGTPTFYTTDRVLTDLLLLKDKMGRRLYETEGALAAALRVKEIVAVEVLEEVPSLLGIIVNLVDYTVGSNKGGELTFFSDFDIDFNQEKYLLETRISGALTKPKSAIVISREQGELATVTAPSFDGETNTISVPTATGVEYLINDTVVTGDQEISEDTEIFAQAKSGYYLESNTTTSWAFTYTA